MNGTVRYDAIRSTKYYARYVTNTKTTETSKTKKIPIYSDNNTLQRTNIQKKTIRL